MADGSKSITAFRAEQPPRLDGLLDDACWQSALRADGFSNLSRPDEPARDQTIFRVAFDDEALYVGVECLESRMDLLRRDLAAMGASFNYEIAEAIEIFLDPPRGKRFAHHFLVGANGATANDNGDALQVGGLPFSAAVALGDDRFFIEAAIPLANLHLTPRTGATWGFNLNRARQVEREIAGGPNDNVYSSWQNTGGAFNRPSRFGRLNLDLDTSPYWYDVALLDAPAAGTDVARFRIVNQTGAPTETKVAVRVAGGKSVEQIVALAPGVPRIVEFFGPFPTGGHGANLTVELQDLPSQRVVYRGASTAVDRTPPPGPAPACSKQDRADRYIAFATDYNTPIRRSTQPELSEIGRPLEIFASPGEDEPCMLGVRTLDGELRNVTLKLKGDLAGPSRARIPRERVDVRAVTETKHWTARGREFRWRPWLVEKSLPAVLAAHRTYFYLLTVRLPADAAPGTYTGEVELRTTGGKTRRIPLWVTVWPITLQQPPDMCWAYYYDSDRLPPGCKNLVYQRKVFGDMVAHGMNNVNVYGNLGADGAVDVSGGPHLPIRPTVDDALAAGLIRPEFPLMTMGFLTHAPAVLEAARAGGWPPLLQYAFDEPNSPERIAEAEAGLTALRRDYPGIQTVTAISENGLKAIGHLYDVWVVEVGSVCSPLVRDALAEGRRVWAYNCADSKGDLAANRLLNGLWSWKTRVSGFWQWAYTDSREIVHRTGNVLRDTFDDDPDSIWPFYFERPDECNPAFSFVLPAPDGPVPSLGHIGRREGVDDYRYTYTLSRWIEAVRALSSADAQQAAADAATLLADIAGRFDVNPWAAEDCGDQTMPRVAPALADGEWRPAPRIRPEDYTRFRREIAGRIIQLQEIERAYNSPSDE